MLEAQEDLTTSDDEPKPIALIIDDNSDIRLFLRTLLSDKYRVLSAANGEEGLRKAQETVPDIIICDVMMPVMDGLECCRRLKTTPATSHIPVLMLTAFAEVAVVLVGGIEVAAIRPDLTTLAVGPAQALVDKVPDEAALQLGVLAIEVPIG